MVAIWFVKQRKLFLGWAQKLRFFQFKFELCWKKVEIIVKRGREWPIFNNENKMLSFFLKMGQSRPLFIYFCLFNAVGSKMFNINFCWWLDSNRGHMASGATALPTEPQPVPRYPSFLSTKLCYAYDAFMQTVGSAGQFMELYIRMISPMVKVLDRYELSFRTLELSLFLQQTTQLLVSIYYQKACFN